jgi:hypothetical protein
MMTLTCERVNSFLVDASVGFVTLDDQKTLVMSTFSENVFCVFFLRFLFSKGTVPLARRAEGDRMGSLLAFTSVIAVD